ncbi:type II secretion system protein GspM [uncultured Methylovirgula sp.]|uniref:type II secretion system protein GspM n=1 Tax=uncultured Methylovirgula sp. TaxID=1285960 RepID=UPI00260B8635|nr:type II secretion system protein GspM [uncultured Methylovirgula sp.]
MMKLTRDQAIAIAALAAVIIACLTAPLLALNARAGAAAALADATDSLHRRERIRRHQARSGIRKQDIAAPAAAYLSAPTSGLAGAQLESYIAQLAAQQNANLISSGIEPDDRPGPVDAVRIQATLNVPYEKLQALLYRIETATPYVFVESIALQPAGETQPVTYTATMQVTFGLRALWRHDHM